LLFQVCNASRQSEISIGIRQKYGIEAQETILKMNHARMHENSGKEHDLYTKIYWDKEGFSQTLKKSEKALSIICVVLLIMFIGRNLYD
jgi:hypothetical protein